MINVAEFVPLHDRIIIRRSEEGSYGSIIIPDAYRGFMVMVEVVAVGAEVRGVKKGDVVALPGVALSQPDWEQGDYAMVREGDVGGIVESAGDA